ncbi:hypothetical protein LTR08_002855 [Meristemomyces frigidus]|nr:hypothetical protein LTR08_002855 [Meristemomyces frigidus]
MDPEATPADQLEQLDNPDSSAATMDPAAPDALNDTATHRALAVVELLERIILHLPPKKIFQLQRINKHFAAVVETSVEIQRTICLAPDPPRSHDSSTGPRINPLLSDLTFVDRLPLSIGEFGYYTTLCYGANGPHASFSSKTKNRQLKIRARKHEFGVAIMLEFNHQFPREAPLPEGSWQKMFFAQRVHEVLIRWPMRRPWIGYHSSIASIVDGPTIDAALASTRGCRIPGTRCRIQGDRWVSL